ncbi:putative transcriptional regulator [Marinobacter daqiaonensis]|uniref:Putative transcriptional regulator n=1 Tax=Marinobacter daqiaonensis TaxID=650891 RepID=A0A1I6IA95_9GAMM|nr:helix-turn-helix domain-containing protein [Marinobacter daqiaonensis]SFR63682.1 putative transcriptional regulator [Marinobacter daqiaonensis]
MIYKRAVKENIPAHILKSIVRYWKMSNETLSAEELGNKLLQSVKEMKAGNAARVSRVEPNEVAEARGRTGLTQREFAEVLHISPRTLQEWEQGRRKPSGPAKALIEIAFRHPEVIREDLELRG